MEKTEDNRTIASAITRSFHYVLHFGIFSADLCGRYDYLLLYYHRRSAPPCEEGGEDVISRLLFRRNHSPVREERFCSLSGRENCRRLAGGPAGEREQMEKMDRNRSDSARLDSADSAPNKVRERSFDRPLYDNTVMGLNYLSPAHFTDNILKLEEIIIGELCAPLVCHIEFLSGAGVCNFIR